MGGRSRTVPDFPAGENRLTYTEKIHEIFDEVAARAEVLNDEAWANAIDAASDLWETEHLPDAGTAAGMLLGAIDATIEMEGDKTPPGEQEGFVAQWLRILAGVVGQPTPAKVTVAVATEILRNATGPKVRPRDAGRLAAITILFEGLDPAHAADLMSASIEATLHPAALSECVRDIVAADPGGAGPIAQTALKLVEIPVARVVSPPMQGLDLVERVERATQKTVKVAAAVQEGASAAARALDAVERGASGILDVVDHGFDAVQRLTDRATRKRRK